MGFVHRGNSIVLCDKLTVDLSSASRWVPPRISVDAESEAIAEAVQELCEAITRRGEQAAPAVVANRVTALSDAWQRQDTSAICEAALSLLGLGPGLTPSGDDVLAGLLAVSRWLEHDSTRLGQFGAALGPAIERETRTRTTRLSARLLAHAANGLLYEPAMHLGAALFSGKTGLIRPSATQLFEIGHTSGVDLAAGILLGARLFLDDRRQTTDDG
jgi:hypothetical protein